ncbi:CoA transferase [Nocardioides massiliensis]|nr:CoA transferase [Nocardioides massiliensis]
MAPGDPAGAAQRWIDLIRLAGAKRGHSGPDLPDAALLGERAALLGLTRSGPSSCGGGFRTFVTRDGWVGISLGRASDRELVPALLADDFPPPDTATAAWPWVARWARQQSTTEAGERLRLLGLPHSLRHRGRAAAASSPERPAVLVGLPGGARTVVERPLVLDFTALWAGPLCAHLLGLIGCQVVKVEAVHRPDGARNGPGDFFDLLHYGHDSVAVDLSEPRDRANLREVASRADLILESSRPAGLARAGLVAAELVAEGTSWLSITAQGRNAVAVGYGDDVAVHSGLARIDGPDLLPVGDALADSLTGLASAAAAAKLLLAAQARMIDVSMDAVCRSVSGPVADHTFIERNGRWWVESKSGLHAIRAPRGRVPGGTARPLGADSDRWMQ